MSSSSRPSGVENPPERTWLADVRAFARWFVTGRGLGVPASAAEAKAIASVRSTPPRLLTRRPAG